MSYLRSVSGKCHCGNIHFKFETNKPAEALVPRTCQCTLCRHHGASYVSDPEGHVALHVEDANAVSRYRFGHGTADFLICRRCGVLVMALCDIEGQTRAVINIKSMLSESFPASPVNTVFDAETVEERLARRKRNWTGRVTLTGLQSHSVRHDERV